MLVLLLALIRRLKVAWVVFGDRDQRCSLLLSRSSFLITTTTPSHAKCRGVCSNTKSKIKTCQQLPLPNHEPAQMDGRTEPSYVLCHLD
jgi:hypothetical protein